MGTGKSMGAPVFVGIGVLDTGTDEAARTHGEVRNSPVSKHAHTPASAAAGIEQAIRMLEGRWKLVILFRRMSAWMRACVPEYTGPQRAAHGTRI